MKTQLRTTLRYGRSSLTCVNETWNVVQRLPDIHDNVIMYHSVGVEDGVANVSTEQFRKHVQWLDEQYELVDLPEIFARSDHKRIVLTFDDGLQSFYTDVVPVLHRYKVPATVFLIGTIIDGTPEEKQRIMRERLEADVEFMSRDQVDELIDDPYVTIGSHTMTHPRLSEVESTSEVRSEIHDGTDAVESKLGVSVDRFCYPYNDAPPEAVEAARERHDICVGGGGWTTLLTPDHDTCQVPRISGTKSLSQLTFDVSDASKYLYSMGSSIIEE